MDPVLPPIVFTLWKLTVVLGFVLFLPLSVYCLHSLWRTASSIRAYANGSEAAAVAIAGHTSALPALDSTIATASEVLSAAAGVAEKLDTIARVMEARSDR
jgi:hypothetical protein